MDFRITIGREWDAFIEHDYSYRGYNVFLRRFQPGGVFFLEGRNNQLAERWIEDGPMGSEPDVFPAFVIRDDLAKALVEGFLKVGIRPDVEARNEGELEATKRHLADLQGIIGRVHGELA